VDNAMKHVLVVDDDPSIRDVIDSYLQEQNFEVSAVADGREMSRVLAAKTVDLIILDLKLADESGLDLMRGLGPRPQVPVILLTGHARDEADRVVGLELGADDYMLKPFALRELLARVRAVLRRSEASKSRSPPKEEKPVRYRFAGWELDTQARTLTWPAGDDVALTTSEFNLLAAFVRSPHRVLNREQLRAASRVHDEEVFDRTIDIQILRLRRKLEPNPSEPQIIKTERTVGYMLAVGVETL
jgi:two-component system, OmpR family, response regulator